MLAAEAEPLVAQDLLNGARALEAEVEGRVEAVPLSALLGEVDHRGPDAGPRHRADRAKASLERVEAHGVRGAGLGAREDAQDRRGDDAERPFGPDEGLIDPRPRPQRNGPGVEQLAGGQRRPSRPMT